MARRKEILGCLCVFLGIFCFALGNWVFRTFMINVDEKDHLVVGYLMSKGWVLYKDIFTHHFPFPYYWVRIFDFMWVNLIPHRGIAMFRTTLNIYYLFCSALVLINLRAFRDRLFFVVFLNSTVLLMPLFHGNLLLSETFGFFPVIMIIWLVFSNLSNVLRENWILVLSSLVLCSMGFWSQPLVFPVFFLPLLYLRKKRRAYLGLVIAIQVLLLLFLWQNGSLAAFTQMGIWFNFNVYSPYYYDIEGVNPGLSGFITKIIDNQFTMMFRPDIKNAVLSLQFIGSWVLCLLGINLILKKNYRLLAGLLLCIFLVRVREAKVNPGHMFNFGVWPYMMFINLVLIWLIRSTRGLVRVFVVASFSLYFFYVIFGSRTIVLQSLIQGYNYHIFWGDREAIGNEMAKLAGDDKNVLVYPHDVDLYYFARKEPPDRFLYWFPWVNQISSYRKERERAIEQKSVRVMYLGGMSFKGENNYYLNMWPDLKKGFKVATTEGKFSNIWVRQ